MVLADTLALAARTQPRLMIDFATLTGACVHALTERMSGVFTNRPHSPAKLMEAGRASGERVWNFPFEADYDADLESKVADIVQCAVDGKGDHILATRFLRALRAGGHPLGARGSVVRHAQRRTGAREHRRHRLRRAFRARAAVARQNCCGRCRAARDALRHPPPRRLAPAPARRGGAARRAALQAARFARAIVMPNLAPPVTTTAAALAYRARILAALPPGVQLRAADDPVPHRPDTAPRRSRAPRRAGVLLGCKLYPAGATTHSDAGRHRRAAHRGGAGAHGGTRAGAAGARRGHRSGRRRV